MTGFLRIAKTYGTIVTSLADWLWLVISSALGLKTIFLTILYHIVLRPSICCHLTSGFIQAVLLPSVMLVTEIEFTPGPSACQTVKHALLKCNLITN